MRHYLHTIAATGISMAIGCSALAANGETSPEEHAAGLANPAAVF